MERSAAIELYEKLVATNPDVVRVQRRAQGRNSGTPSSRQGTREFLKKYKATLSSQFGSVQPEYVVVPDTLLAKTRELKRYFDISYDYVASLKPKPTTKKKK